MLPDPLGMEMEDRAPSPEEQPVADGEKSAAAEAEGIGGDAAAEHSDSSEDAYLAWKRNIMCLYDNFAHSNMMWPALTVCWGPKGNTMGHRDDEAWSWRTAFVSTRTDATFCERTQSWSGGDPSRLHLMDVRVAQPRVADPRSLAKFSESTRSSCFSVAKTIVHPGEVNRARANPLAPHIVATHTDSPVIFLWHAWAQRDRGADATGPASEPDMCLVGHNASAEYALAWSDRSHCVASGGSDQQVLVWSLLDAERTLARVPTATEDASPPSCSTRARCLLPRASFVGHEGNVEDVAFAPGCESILASVGVDRSLCLWDARAGQQPVLQFRDLHADDINCLAWHPTQQHCLATGGSDCAVQVLDVRSARQVALGRHTRKGSVTTLQWVHDPSAGGAFLAVGGDDERIAVLRQPSLAAASPHDGASPSVDATPPDEMPVVFQHCGHRAPIVDFAYTGDAEDLWLCLSTSDDGAKEDLGGGTLQLWRMTELVLEAAARGL